MLLRPVGKLLLVLLLLAACSDSTGPGSVRGFRITPDQSTLEAGAELQLTAVLASGNGDTIPAEELVWSSSHPDIASVSSGGYVSAHRTGVSTIAGLLSGERATATISVERRFKASEVAVGQDHVCALDLEGRAWCFGQDRGGSLGHGTFWQATESMTFPVLNAPVFSAIIVTRNTSCGLSLVGQVWCWGSNSEDGLGHFVRGEDSAIPVLADTIRTYEFIAGGSSNTCGLSSEVLYCWGLAYGAPGPPLADQGIRFSHISVGTSDDCGVTIDGAGLCWYAPPYTGPSGPPSPRFSRLSTAHDPDALGPYVCGISVEAAVFCWGENRHGQLGDGTEQRRAEPNRIMSPHRFMDITTHPRHACGLTDTGVVHCWGANESGQLGRGDSAASSIPQPVDTPVRFSRVETYSGSPYSSEPSRVCAISSDNDLFCWGEGFGSRPTPVLY